jgi:hypothetical protein
MKSDVKQQVINWLQHKDYESGVTILSGIRPQMSRIMSGRPHRYQKKLEYELKKLIGKDHLSMALTTNNVVEAKPKTVEQARVKQPKAGKKPPATSKQKPVVKAQVVEQPKPQPKKEVRQPEAKESKEKAGFDLSAAHESLDEVPAEIERIVKEHAQLFMLRSKLSEERYDVPQTNSRENVKKRCDLTAYIHGLSERIEALYNAHAEYLKTRKLPDMEALFPSEKPKKQPAKKPTEAQLKRERNTLMSGNRRDKNKLEYQSDRKLSKRNPMPEGPKRSELIKRVADRNRRITQINKLLKQ